MPDHQPVGATALRTRDEFRHPGPLRCRIPTVQTTRRLRYLGALAGLLLLVLAPACGGGGGDDSSGSDDETGAATSGAVAGDSVDIEDFVFKPPMLRAVAGEAVTFTNKDTFDHTVTARDKSYDSGDMGEGAVFEHVYDEPGTYEYFCAIHNSMTGSVIVE